MDEFLAVCESLVIDLAARAHIDADDARLLLCVALENTREIVLGEALGDQAEG